MAEWPIGRMDQMAEWSYGRMTIRQNDHKAERLLFRKNIKLNKSQMTFYFLLIFIVEINEFKIQQSGGLNVMQWWKCGFQFLEKSPFC